MREKGNTQIGSSLGAAEKGKTEPNLEKKKKKKQASIL